MSPKPVVPDLAALADRHDPESRDAFVSVYADFTDPRWERPLAARADAVRAAAGDDDWLLKNFDASLKDALAAVAKARGPDVQGAAAFASREHGFVVAYPLARPVASALVLDSGPYVRPLARFADEYEAFVLVLIDGERAVVYLVDHAIATQVGRAKMDLIGRHKKGGWSQMRYQRHRQGRVDALLDEIATKVEALVASGEADRVIVAGPGQAKRHLVASFPKTLADAVVAVEDVDLGADSDADLVRRFIALARDEEAEDSEHAAAAIKSALKSGDLAVTGPFAVARAARDGRVALLLVVQDHVAGARKCEAHDAYFEDDGHCACGAKGSQVDLVNEAMEDAIASEARIEFVPAGDPFLVPLGGAAALLRW